MGTILSTAIIGYRLCQENGFWPTLGLATFTILFFSIYYIAMIIFSPIAFAFGLISMVVRCIKPREEN